MKISRFIRFAGCKVVKVAVLVMMVVGCASASFDLGALLGKHTQPAGYLRTKAYVMSSPEISLGFQKVPIMVPLPMLIFRKKKHLYTKPVSMPICSGECSGAAGSAAPGMYLYSNSGSQGYYGSPY